MIRSRPFPTRSGATSSSDSAAAEWIDKQRTRWERLFDAVGEYLEERKDRE